MFILFHFISGIRNSALLFLRLSLGAHDHQSQIWENERVNEHKVNISAMFWC